MTNLIHKSLTELASLIRRKEVSPVQVMESFLEQIEAVNPKLNAIITLAPDLLEQAKVAEQEIKENKLVGPLHGVPVTVKDTIETGGLRTTSGSKIRKDFVPERDAPAVALLKAAGAIILGKTNTAEMAMDYTADNPVFGRTNHPIDAALTPGGSSGGEAASIASYMSPAGIRSDLAGSIRIPAHFCGVAGLKPTVGRIPGEGQFPPSSGPYGLGAAIGPLARNVADLELMFRVLANSTAPSELELKGVRLAWYGDDGVVPVTDETRQTIKTAASFMEDAGMICEERVPPHVQRGNELWLNLFSRASVVQLRKVYAGRESEGGSFVSWRLANADHPAPPTLDQYISDWMERDRLREELLSWMETTPILLAPVGSTPAYLHNTLKVNVAGNSFGTFRAFSYAQAFNVFDLPVVVVPVGRTVDGLPIGVQVVGRPFHEEMVLAVARELEQRCLYLR